MISALLLLALAAGPSQSTNTNSDRCTGKACAVQTLTATGAAAAQSFNSTAASTTNAFSCTNTGARLSLGNVARYMVDNPTASPSSLSAWQLAGMSQVQILAQGIAESGTLMLKQSDTGAYNTLDFQDNNGVLKFEIGYGNSATAAQYAATPFIAMTTGLDLPIFNFSNTELVRIKSTGGIKSSAAATVNAFETLNNARIAMGTGGAYLYSDGSVNTFSSSNFISNNSFYAANGFYGVSGSGKSITIQSSTTDGASAVSALIQSGNTLATVGAKLLQLKNNTVEAAYFDKDGKFVTTSGVAATTNITTSGGYVAADTVQDFNGVGPLTLKGGMADSATAVAVASKTSATWSTDGAKLHSFRNNATEKAYVSLGGFVGLGSVATASLPTCDATHHKYEVAVDSTLNTLLFCNGTVWKTVTTN